MDISSGMPSHIPPIPCKNKEVYSDINTLIYEYLEVNGLEQALTTFSKECVAKNLPCPRLPSGSRKIKAAFTHYDGDLLLKSFDEGDLESFLKLWKQFQNHIQVTSEDMKKLEVYLRVHFAIFPKAHNHPETKQTQAMQMLKQFFEENSASLSSDATILPLFALPFVADPRPHPIFKDLFHESWTSKLRAQLETTVNKYFELLQENITNHCKLASVVAKSSKQGTTTTGTQMSPTTTTVPIGKSPQRRASLSKTGSLSNASFNNKQATTTDGNVTRTNSEVIPQSLLTMTENAMAYHQERFLQLLTIHRKTRKVLKGVRDNYTKLLKVSSILITALERTLTTSSNSSQSTAPTSSQPSANLDLILHQCLLIYPEIFTNPSNEATPAASKPDLNHFKQLVAASSSTTTVVSTCSVNGGADASDVSLLFLGLSEISLETLDYARIKEDLVSEKKPPTDRLCLLQALRWLITKTSPALRALVIGSFVEHDLLGLSPRKSYAEKLFASLLSPTPTYQKESLARLVNAFASTWSGRSYLTSTTLLIDFLIRSLSTFKTQEESFICHMVIATLQKLSLRHAMRLFMIDHQVIPWLVKYIKTELERDLLRSEVSQVIQASGASASAASNSNNNNNNDESYGDATFNTYLMEYAWALLMNLALHPESIKSALTVDFEFLHCILTMLTSKSSFEYFPYVLSTLFSLLRNPEFFDKAKSMELNKKLNPVISHQPPEIQRHLRHLISQLYEKSGVDRLTASGETDYDDTDNPDPEEVEPELELPESWMVNQPSTEQLLTGDDLLIREYILPNLTPPPPGGKRQTDSKLNSQHSLSSQQQSIESSYSLQESSRENSSETPPSNDNGPPPKSGLILRPTTPTHTKSPRVSRAETSLTRSGTPTKRTTSTSPNPPPPGQTKLLKNPFLQQFNNICTAPISHLLPNNELSSSEQAEETEVDGRTTTRDYEAPHRVHDTDSITTGKFSLHESPLVPFHEFPFVDTNRNFESENDLVRSTNINM